MNQRHGLSLKRYCDSQTRCYFLQKVFCDCSRNMSSFLRSSNGPIMSLPEVLHCLHQNHLQGLLNIDCLIPRLVCFECRLFAFLKTSQVIPMLVPGPSFKKHTSRPFTQNLILLSLVKFVSTNQKAPQGWECSLYFFVCHMDFQWQMLDKEQVINY